MFRIIIQNCNYAQRDSWQWHWQVAQLLPLRFAPSAEGGMVPPASSCILKRRRGAPTCRATLFLSGLCLSVCPGRSGCRDDVRLSPQKLEPDAVEGNNAGNRNRSEQANKPRARRLHRQRAQWFDGRANHMANFLNCHSSFH